MALLSVLTPVLAVVLCLVVGFMLFKSRDSENTSTPPNKTHKAASRPWVDQDLQDDTETTATEDGRSWKQTSLTWQSSFFVPIKTWKTPSTFHAHLNQWFQSQKQQRPACVCDARPCGCECFLSIARHGKVNAPCGNAQSKEKDFFFFYSFQGISIGRSYS